MVVFEQSSWLLLPTIGPFVRDSPCLATVARKHFEVSLLAGVPIEKILEMRLQKLAVAERAPNLAGAYRYTACDTFLDHSQPVIVNHVQI